MKKIKRWYDKSDKLCELIKVLETMSDEELELVSKYLYQVTNLFRKQRRNYEQNLSIGKDKLFGYYKTYQNPKRWYDRNPSLKSAFNIMSTFSRSELDEIVNGFLFALRESGMYHIYLEKEQQLIDKNE